MERDGELVGGGLGGEVNIEWREGKQVEVLVQDGKAESEESNGEAIWRQPTHHEHSPTREELASEDGINVVEVEQHQHGRTWRGYSTLTGRSTSILRLGGCSTLTESVPPLYLGQ